MKNKNSYTFSFKVLAIMAAYLFIAVAHIFFLSNNTSVKTSHTVSLFKRKVENMQSVSAVQRTDKATFKETSIKSAAKIAVLNLSALFVGGGTARNVKQLPQANALAYGGNGYAYISFCSFRI